MERSQAQLEYAPHLAPQKRRAALHRLTRRIFWSALVVVTLAVTWRMSKQAYYLYRQNELTSCAAAFGPLEIDGKQNVDRIVWPAAARELLGKATNFPVFIHARRSRDGTSRLIIVEELYADDSGSGTRVLHATPYVTASALPGSHLQPRLSSVLTHPPMRIVEAKLDEHDPSHFTITYELAGERGTIDAWLIAEGSVTLEPRDGPLKEPWKFPAREADTPGTRTPSSRPA
jgi:hypothetical protein